MPYVSTAHPLGIYNGIVPVEDPRENITLDECCHSRAIDVAVTGEVSKVSMADVFIGGQV